MKKIIFLLLLLLSGCETVPVHYKKAELVQDDFSNQIILQLDFEVGKTHNHS